MTVVDICKKLKIY